MTTSARSLAVFLLTAGPCATSAFSQASSVKWEELTAGDFQQAIRKAQETCVLPFGIIEKHGPHLPLGTDLINVRYVEHGAQQGVRRGLSGVLFRTDLRGQTRTGDGSVQREAATGVAAGDHRRDGAQ